MAEITNSNGNKGRRSKGGRVDLQGPLNTKGTPVKWVEKQCMESNTIDFYLFAHKKLIIRKGEAFHLKQEDLGGGRRRNFEKFLVRFG